MPGPHTSVLLELLVEDELVTVPVAGSTVVVGVCVGADPLVMWQFEPYGEVGAWLRRVEATPGFVNDLEPYPPGATAGAGGPSVHG